MEINKENTKNHTDKNDSIKISNDISLVMKNWEWSYYKNWEFLFDFVKMRSLEKNIQKMLYMAWYREISKNWKFYLYNTDNINSETWQPIKWAKYINPTSYEYYYAWESALLLDWRAYLLSIQHKFIDTKKYPELDINLIKHYTELESVKISDLLQYRENKQLSEKQFQDLLKIMTVSRKDKTSILERQCVNTRLNRIGQELTKQELDGYFEYIDRKLYDNCIHLIARRDQNIRDMAQISQITHSKLQKSKPH